MTKDFPCLFENGKVIPVYNFDHVFENMLASGEENMAYVLGMHKVILHTCERGEFFAYLEQGRAFFTLAAERIVDLGMERLANKVLANYHQIRQNIEFFFFEEVTGIFAPVPSLN